MSLTTTHHTLLNLLEQKRFSNHHKVALRYYFMLEALGYPIPAPHRNYCGAAMRRCTPRDLERIRRAARDWASFVNDTTPRADSSFAFAFHDGDINDGRSFDSDFCNLFAVHGDEGLAMPANSEQAKNIALNQTQQLIARVSR